MHSKGARHHEVVDCRHEAGDEYLTLKIYSRINEPFQAWVVIDNATLVL